MAPMSVDKSGPVGDDLSDIICDSTFANVNTTTSSITTRFLVAMFDDAKIGVDDVLLAAGVTRDALSSPDCRMPLDLFRELWARAAKLQPDIGMRMVDRFPEGQMHIVAHLAMRSANVGEALDAVCRYMSVASEVDVMQIEIAGGVVRLSYEYRYGGQANPWLAEHYFSMILVFLSRAVGRELSIRGIEFALPAQAAHDIYLERFGAVPAFDTGRNSIEFDETIMSWPLRTHDAYLHQVLDKLVRAEYGVERKPASTAHSFLDMLRREIAKEFLKGVTPTMETVSVQCGLSVRALRERVACEQTTFRQLLDEVRRSLASEHLSRGLSVNEADYLLGFSEPSAFQHACKRWFEKSAGELRKQLIDTSGIKP